MLRKVEAHTAGKWYVGKYRGKRVISQEHVGVLVVVTGTTEGQAFIAFLRLAEDIMGWDTNK